MRPEGGGGGTSGATHSSVQSGTHRGPLVGNDGVASTTECHAREAYVTARHGGDALLDVERPPPSQMINKSNTPLPTAESSPVRTAMGQFSSQQLIPPPPRVHDVRLLRFASFAAY
ncbi:hypothetical protein BHM03_00034236 [Ensete ventricosum]|nr:hypothetical protein BHM03_00034236 [Ensete ventricosum]